MNLIHLEFLGIALGIFISYFLLKKEIKSDLTEINTRFDRIDKRFEEIEKKLNSIENRITHMEGAFSMFGYILPHKPSKKTGTEGK